MQSNKLYIGNLPFSVDESELRDLFSRCGEISELTLITDRATGQSKGFAFVTFGDEGAAKKALELSGKDLSGRPLRVSIAEQRDAKARGDLRGPGRRGGYSYPRSSGSR